jgi:hypothetical protein
VPEVETVAAVSFGLTVFGVILAIVSWLEGGKGGASGRPAEPPPRPDEGPSGTLISGPEVEMLWFQYHRRLDEWERSGRRGPRPRLLAALGLVVAGLIGLGVSLAVIIF